MKKINVEVAFKEERQMKEFMKMLARMEYCGNIGHYTDFLVGLDGDGSARPKFKFEDVETQKTYEDLRRSMSDIKYPLRKEEVLTDLHISIS